jgi:hypothetical protein
MLLTKTTKDETDIGQDNEDKSSMKVNVDGSKEALTASWISTSY